MKKAIYMHALPVLLLILAVVGYQVGHAPAQHFASFLVFAIMLPMQLLALEDRTIAATSAQGKIGTPYLKRALMLVAVWQLVWHGAIWTGAGAFFALALGMAFTARVNECVENREAADARAAHLKKEAQA